MSRILQNRRFAFAGDSLCGQVHKYLYRNLPNPVILVDTTKNIADFHQTLIDGTPSMSFFVPSFNATFNLYSLHYRDEHPQSHDVTGGVDFTMLKSILTLNDVILVHYNVHFNAGQQTAFDSATLRTIRILKTINSARPRRKLGLMAEALPQHFSSADGSGEYESKRDGNCSALRDGYISWRVCALRRIARNERFDPWVVSLWNIGSRLPGLHVKPSDCTHWCTGSAMNTFYQTLFDPVLRRISQHLPLNHSRK
eukprot:g5068.t1